MTAEGVTIVFDGQCPFCARYVGMLRLREAVGPVRLVDARSGHPRVRSAQAAGIDLDLGMVVDYGGATYHGAAAMNLLALLSTGSGAFNRVAALLFRSRSAARFFYPLLLLGRRTTLRLLGRRRIGGAD